MLHIPSKLKLTFYISYDLHSFITMASWRTNLRETNGIKLIYFIDFLTLFKRIDDIEDQHFEFTVPNFHIFFTPFSTTFWSYLIIFSANQLTHLRNLISLFCTLTSHPLL